MYFFDKCCICLINKHNLKHLFDIDNDEISYYNKLTSSIVEMNFEEMNNQRLICGECCVTLNTVYNFRQMCLRNKTNLITYISQLQTSKHVSDKNRFKIKEITHTNKKIHKKTQKENSILRNVLQSSKDQVSCNTEIIKFEDHDIEIHYENENSINNFEKVFVPQNVVGIKYDQSEEDIHTSVSIKDEFDSEEETNFTYEDSSMNENQNIGRKMSVDKHVSRDEFKEPFVDNQFESEKFYEVKNEYIESNEISLPPSHYDNRTYQCKICHQTFINTRILRDHIRFHAGKYYECKICKKKFKHKPNFIFHMRSHPNIRPYKCNICHRRFIYKNNLKDHMRIHSGVVESLKVKEKITLQKPDLTPSKDTVSNNAKTKVKESTKIKTPSVVRIYECEICQKQFKNKNYLKEHTRLHSGGELYECKVCNKRFVHKVVLNAHMKCHSSERSFQCELCERQFIYKSNLKQHLKVHTGERPHACEFCELRFAQKGALAKHIRVHTGVRPYACELCEKTFIQKCNLTVHMRMHNGERPFKCNLCDKSFVERCNLTKHLLVHSGEKPFDCELCGKKFIRKAVLNRHMIIHTSERPYKCKVCQESFRTNFNLKEHSKVHFGEAFECGVCKKTFTNKRALSKHSRIHTGEQLYQCNLCDKNYTRKEKLTNHLKTHSEQPKMTNFVGHTTDLTQL